MLSILSCQKSSVHHQCNQIKCNQSIKKQAAAYEVECNYSVFMNDDN